MFSVPVPEEDFLEADWQPVAASQLRLAVEGRRVWASRALGTLAASGTGWGSRKRPVFPLSRSKGRSELLFREKSSGGCGDLRASGCLPGQMSCSGRRW